jgi:hypothetical protein
MFVLVRGSAHSKDALHLDRCMGCATMRTAGTKCFGGAVPQGKPKLAPMGDGADLGLCRQGVMWQTRSSPIRKGRFEAMWVRCLVLSLELTRQVGEVPLLL